MERCLPLPSERLPSPTHSTQDPGRCLWFFVQRLYCLTCWTKTSQPRPEQAAAAVMWPTPPGEFGHFSLPHKNTPSPGAPLGKQFVKSAVCGLRGNQQKGRASSRPLPPHPSPHPAWSQLESGTPEAAHPAPAPACGASTLSQAPPSSGLKQGLQHPHGWGPRNEIMFAKACRRLGP